MERMILHSDINACYASIELLRHPELRGRPVAVGGERELRHGIILAKDQMARAAGMRTGMTLWAARQQCPELTILPPDFDLYYDYSRRVLRSMPASPTGASRSAWMSAAGHDWLRRP
ncbi:MAG: DNA polymerase IV [Oscillospiraceae bacterium]